jgi:sugar phosphate isomerase/epimerase
MNTVKKGLQLYTVRFDAADDLYAVLTQVKAMGYDGVEFAGLFGHDAADIRSHLDALGLKCIAGHVSLDMLTNSFDSTIATYKTLGCEFIVLGFLEEEHRHYGSTFDQTVARAENATAACREAGLPLAYHNHNFEFMNAEAGNGLDLLLSGAKSLQVQFDTGWLGIAGQDPVALLHKYVGRYTSVHLKDYLESKGTDYDFCPIGHGVLDYPSIIAAAVTGGAQWIIVDQDSDARRPALEAARLSAQFMKSLGY